MKIIYGITCHRMTNPLLHTVNHLSSFEENIILIHVDKKSDIEDFLILRKSNVHFISDRINVTWGSALQIESVLELMKFSLNFQYDFFFLLSGDDIPLKSNIELKEFLNTFADYNFIDFDKQATDEHIEGRVKYIYPNVFFQRDTKALTRTRRIPFRLAKNIFYRNKLFKENSYRMPILYKGSNWFGLKIDTIKYILNYIDVNEWFLRLFDKSLCADEIFFHSIIKTDPKIELFESIDYPISSLRYIDWQSGPEYPKMLKEEDMLKIKYSNCFFARKISPDSTQEFMDYFLENK